MMGWLGYNKIESRDYPPYLFVGTEHNYKSLLQENRSMIRGLISGPPEFEADLINIPLHCYIILRIIKWRTSVVMLEYHASGNVW
jgi:hypothetical protein